MKKLIIIASAIIFTGITTSCKKVTAHHELADIHSFTNGFKRDLGSAD